MTEADNGINPLGAYISRAIWRSPWSGSVRKSIFESRITFGWG